MQLDRSWAVGISFFSTIQRYPAACINIFLVLFLPREGTKIKMQKYDVAARDKRNILR